MGHASHFFWHVSQMATAIIGKGRAEQHRSVILLHFTRAYVRE
jgi:hypothetical protein